MPRFVLLLHDHPTVHWDLMLERGNALRTWRLARSPAADGRPIPAEPLPDHRIAYLDYEGPISGNRGTVARLDGGDYEIVDSSARRLVVRLAGRTIRAKATLDCAANPPTWTFDPPADPAAFP